MITAHSPGAVNGSIFESVHRRRSAFPSAAVFGPVLAPSLIGDGLNDALNPRLRQR